MRIDHDINTENLKIMPSSLGIQQVIRTIDDVHAYLSYFGQNGSIEAKFALIRCL